MDEVIDRIREEVTSGRWPVGTRIPAEPQLVEQLGVARNTLREALRALSHVGVLDVRHGDGTYVLARDESQGALRRRLELADLLDLLAVRRGLEVEAARQAALRRTRQDLARLRRLVTRRSGDGTVDARVEGALDFHTAVVAASHNPLLVDLYDAIASASSAGMRQAATDPALPDLDDDPHTELLDAVADGDPERAGTAAARHLDILIHSVRHRLP
ncbi:FadR/GntR family transcriptional regulator [Solihabitans fulvus]|uniref:FadR/GntR family transcriptional regulator n=1 Tax=Solihabitans fulvus TaxID=1892852 RepID=UPI001CB7627F|nr:FCD domain-containing protein [Solihabitans fulvus]